MNRNTTLRRFAGLALAVSALFGTTLATAGTAVATSKDGVMDAYEFGLYYNSGRSGCVFDLLNSDLNFAGDKFWRYGGGCAGHGQKTNDNTASYWNRYTQSWYVYTDSDADGAEGSLPAGYTGNASSTFKNKVSSAFPYDAG